MAGTTDNQMAAKNYITAISKSYIRRVIRRVHAGDGFGCDAAGIPRRCRRKPLLFGEVEL
jgi:hypothetical protein